MICNYCRSEESDIIAEYTRFEKNNVLQCQNCGLVYLELKKSKEEIESYYSSDYCQAPTHQRLSADEHFHNKVIQNDANNRILFITENLDIRGKRILEVGSASGSLLHKLIEYGCREAIGIELTEEYANYARSLGFTVYTHPIEELNLREEFDGVVSFHTLEHVYDPMAVIQAVYRALKPNGYFLGEVPNQNDWRIQIFDDKIVKRLHYDPDHYYYYSPITLRNYLGTCGFNNITLQTIERYNSLVQLRNILRNQGRERNAEEALRKYIFPKNEREEVRLPHVDDPVESRFNRLFERGVNLELMGNCLRFVTEVRRVA